MSRTACLIFNPAAGQGDSKQDLQTIRHLLDPHLDLSVYATSQDVSTGDLTQSALDQGFNLVIASGGDGTVSAVAAALVHTTIPLGIIGRGTANAFANALGIPTELKEACRVIAEGATQTVDAAQCNGHTMVLLAGIGLGAEVIQQADRDAKNRFGIFAYILAGVEQLQNLELFSAEIDIDCDRKIEVSAGAITVANAAPATSILAQGPAGVIPNDRRLDLTIIAPESKLEAMIASYGLLSSALRGEAATQQGIGYLQAEQVRIVTDPIQRVMIDGELIGTTPLEVRCLPKALVVLTPCPMPAHAGQSQESLENLPDLQVTSVLNIN